MKKSNFSEPQIIKILVSQESGKSVADICGEHGISQDTFYKGKSKYSGMEVCQVKQLKDLEKELAQYKKIVAELRLQACRKAGSRRICQRNIPDEPSAGLHIIFYQHISI